MPNCDLKWSYLQINSLVSSEEQSGTLSQQITPTENNNKIQAAKLSPIEQNNPLIKYTLLTKHYHPSTDFILLSGQMVAELPTQ